MPKTRKYGSRDRKGKKTRRALKRKGGSRRELDLYKSARNMRDDMDFFLVSAHGTTTSDNYFIIVPENTYMVFTTASGTLAPGEFKELDELEVAGQNKNAYYQTLYDRMFTPGGSKYPGESFIYEPGDLIPDYSLGFKNNGYFYAKMGVFELPFTNPFPGIKGDYLGRTVTFIKRLLDAKLLTEEDVSSLTGEIAEHLKTKTAEDIEAHAYYKDLFEQITLPYLEFWEKHDKNIMNRINESNRWNKTHLNSADPVEFKDLPLRGKLDYFSTFTKDNLVKDLLLPSKKHNLRVSNVLRKVNPNPAKKRFFFMSFCRPSYEDILTQYQQKRSVPKLLRALSFSQKCTVGNEDKVLNIKKLFNVFASLSFEQRKEFINTKAGQRFTYILKKIYKADWTTLLEGTYHNVNPGDRIDNLISPYIGHITPEFLNELSNLHADLAAYPEIAKPLQQLDEQIDKYDADLQKIAEEKQKLIEEIYDVVFQETGYGKVKRGKKTVIHDFLYLRNVAIDTVRRFHKRLPDPEFLKFIHHNYSNSNYTNHENEQKFIRYLLFDYSGSQYVSMMNYNMFNDSDKESVDTSISFEDLGSNNENEENEENKKPANNGSNSNSTKTGSHAVVSNNNTNSNSNNNGLSLYKQMVQPVVQPVVQPLAQQKPANVPKPVNAAPKPRYSWENNNFGLE